MEAHLEAIDCIEGMRKLPDNSVHVCVTSPPYNIRKKYRSYSDSLSEMDYLTWTLTWCAEVKRVLRDDGSFFLNLGACPRMPLLPMKTALAIEANHFKLQNTFHWIKSITVPVNGVEVSRGHFKPINSKRFVHCAHEFIFHFTKNGDVPLDRLAVGVDYVDASNVKRWAHTGGKNKRCRGNTWYLPYDTIVSSARQRPHPAPFPPALASNCILIHGAVPHMCVLDCFLGIGNSAIAAKRIGVYKFYGFDTDAGYIRDAKSALAAA